MGQAFRQNPHWTHLYRSSSAGASGVMNPLSGVFGVDFKQEVLSLDFEGEPTRIQSFLRVELVLHIPHDLGRSRVDTEDVDLSLDH